MIARALELGHRPGIEPPPARDLGLLGTSSRSSRRTTTRPRSLARAGRVAEAHARGGGGGRGRPRARRGHARRADGRVRKTARTRRRRGRSWERSPADAHCPLGPCLRAGGVEHVRRAESEVTFAPLSPADVEWYRDGEWRDWPAPTPSRAAAPRSSARCGATPERRRPVGPELPDATAAAQAETGGECRTWSRWSHGRSSWTGPTAQDGRVLDPVHGSLARPGWTGPAQPRLVPRAQVSWEPAPPCRRSPRPPGPTRAREPVRGEDDDLPGDVVGLGDLRSGIVR